MHGILHRTRCLIVGASVLSLLWPMSAQNKPATGSKGPRAIAVLEWNADGPRLVPVAIRVDGKYHDAGLFEAAPVPIALYADTVYEVEHGGASLGLFTIADARQTPEGWFGEGKFKTKAQVEAEHKPKPQEVEKPKPEPDQRPVLRRSKPAASAPTPNSPPSFPPTPAPAPQTASAPTPVPPAPATTAKPAATDSSDDSGRPVLKRGAGEGTTQAEKMADPKLKHKAPSTPPPGLTRTEVAVSDASGPEPHSYVWEAKPDQLQRLRKQVEQIATATVQAYAKAHPGMNSSSMFQDAHMNLYDLNVNNEPYVVFTARVPQQSKTPTRQARAGQALAAADQAKPAAQEEQPPAAPNSKDIYVTVVGRQDYDQQLRKVLTSVTDGTRLDVTQRLEFIDAVDADGDGRGDLLFRQVSDQGTSYVIYRVIADTAKVAFNSGAPQEY